MLRDQFIKFASPGLEHQRVEAIVVYGRKDRYHADPKVLSSNSQSSAPPIALYFQETSKFSPGRSTCHRTWTQGPNWDLAPISATELAAQWWSWATQMVMLSVQAFQVVVDIKHFLGAKYGGFQLKFFSQEQVSLNFERHPQVEYFWQVGDAEFCKQPGCRRLADTMNMERRWKDYALASHSHPPQCTKPDTNK